MAQHELLVKLGLQSDSFTRNLRNVNNQLKLTEAEFNKVKAGSANFGNSQKDLEIKLKSLGKTKEQLTAKTILYQNKIKDLNNNIESSSKKHEKLTTKLEAEKKKLDSLEKTQGTTSKAYKDQEKVVKNLQEQYDKSKKKIENLNLSLQKHKIDLTNTEAALKNVSSAINDVKFEKMTIGLTNLSGKLATTSEKLGKISQAFGAAGATLTASITTPIVGAGTKIVKFGADYEASMSKVQALSRASASDLAQLEAKAREMGKQTSYTAKEAADGLGYMALAGWKTKEMLVGIEPVLRLAEAGNLDLATTSDLVTDSMSSLGLEANELEGYLNKVARASSSSNTDIDQMLRTYNQVGGTFQRLNVPLEESGALIGILANRGLKAEQAGRAVSSLFINITGGSETAAAAMNKLGVKAYDSKGKFRGVEVVLKDLHDELNKTENGTRKYTDAQKDMYLKMIGGKTQIRTLDAMLNGISRTTENGKTEFQNLRYELENCDGALADMAYTMKDNVQGDWEKFTSMVGELALSINDILSPAIRDILQHLTGLVEKFVNMDEQTKKFIVKAALIAASVGPIMLAFSGVTKVLSLFTGGLSRTIKGFVGFGKTCFDVFNSVKNGSSIFAALGSSIAGLPAILTIAGGAIAGLATILGENEFAISRLQEKWGAFGTFISGACEMIAGYVQLSLGNIVHLLGTIGKVIGKFVTMQWSEIDDVIKEGSSKMAQNTEKAFDNIGMSSTKAIQKMRQLTSQEMSGLVDDMQYILDNLPGITYDSASQAAEKFAQQFAKLDNDSIQILTSTSETMNMLFRGIEEGMSNELAVKLYTNNLKSLARTGGVSASELKNEIEKTLNLINDNMADSGDRFAREAEVAMDKFGKVASMGVNSASTDIAKHLSSLDSNTTTQLRNMGNSWARVFRDVRTDGSMETKEMADIIQSNIRKMAEDNPKFVKSLQEEMKQYFDKLPEDAKENMLALSEEVSKGSKNAEKSSEGTGKKIEENLKFEAEGNTKEELNNVQNALTESNGSLASAAESLGNSTTEGYDSGLSGLDEKTANKLADQANSIASNSGLAESAMADNAASSVEGFVKSWDSNAPRINESINSTFENINRLTLLKWGNTTKGLSEVNKWLGTVSNKAASTKSALTPLTLLKWGNTTKGLSETNRWLGNVSKSAKSTKAALTPLTSLKWGNTTKGLSEVNKWLGNVTKSARTTRTALKNILSVTYGSVTKGLSEINRWLGNVKSSASSAKSYLQSMASVRFGGLTKSLSEVNRWLGTVSAKAATTRTAIASVSAARPKTVSLITEEQSDKMAILSRENINLSDYNIERTDLNRRSAIEKGITTIATNASSTANQAVNNTIINTLVKQNELLMNLLSQSKEIIVHNDLAIDGRSIARSTAKYMTDEIKTIDNRRNRLAGI